MVWQARPQNRSPHRMRFARHISGKLKAARNRPMRKLDYFPLFRTITHSDRIIGAYNMYAIIADSGRQYRVTSGQVIRIDRPDEEAKSITFNQVLLVGGEGEPKVGTPFVSGATVAADVLGPVKAKKVHIIKYKRRK